MTPGQWFWIIYVVICIFGGYLVGNSGDRRWIGGGFVVFVLLGLLGWGLFGAPIK